MQQLDKRVKWLNEESAKFLQRGYLKKGEQVYDRIIEIADRAFKEIYPNEEYHKEFIHHMLEGDISLSSPVWANYGRPRSLAISCFGTYFDDTMHSIMFGAAENGLQTKYGGGTSQYFNLRHRGAEISTGGYSEGNVNFARLIDTTVDVTQQAGVRRGAAAIYLEIENPDIEEFLTIRHEGSPIQKAFTGVCVGDDWLQEMEAGDSAKRKIWAKVLQSRQRVGIPYIFFKDNVNNKKPSIYKDTNSTIFASNLCSEIMLPSSELESFVCCLASLVATNYRTWKNTRVVKILTAFLDTVLTDFIETASTEFFLQRTVNFATRHRAIGIGLLGYHSLLQSEMLAFEDPEAAELNVEIFKHIREESYEESERLGQELGVAPIFHEVNPTETPRRNTTTMAVAPTMSSSFIMGQLSQGIEPYRSNMYVRDVAKSKIIDKNPYLIKLLEEKGKYTPEVIDSIVTNFGSVSHLDFLDDHEKNVFKTFAEISPYEIIAQAAERQQYIDQGQSLNLMIHPSMETKEVNKIILSAHKMGLKSLYYQHSINAAQAFSKNFVGCSSCEA